jgi:dCMP deaminase
MINELGWDVEKDVPCKELYAMHLAFNITLRSIDKSTKHGSIAFDKEGCVLTSGYNGPVRGSDDKIIPQTRPEKYGVFEHAEKNLIYTAARKGIALDGSIFYVTGFPCTDCLRGIIQSGVTSLIYGPLNGAHMFSDQESMFKTYGLILRNQSIKIKKFAYKEGLLKLNPWLIDILAKRPDIELPIDSWINKSDHFIEIDEKIY